MCSLIIFTIYMYFFFTTENMSLNQYSFGILTSVKVQRIGTIQETIAATRLLFRVFGSDHRVVQGTLVSLMLVGVSSFKFLVVDWNTGTDS